MPDYVKRICELYEAVHDRFGEEGLELIREVSRSYGSRIAEYVNKGGQVKGVVGVGKYLLKVFDMVAGDWSIQEFTLDRLVISVSHCPYPFTRDEICRAHTCMEQALVKGLDDSLEYKIGRSIPQGDVCCEHIRCKKAGW